MNVIRRIIHAPELKNIPARPLVDIPAQKSTLGSDIRSASPISQDETINELANNFANAISKWVDSGLPVSSKELYETRSSICNQCEYWDGKARFGLGKCNVKGCGCTSMKRWLATEKCPLSKW